MNRYRIHKALCDKSFTVFDESDSIAAVTPDLDMATAIAEAGNMGLLRLRLRKLVDLCRLHGMDVRSKQADQLMCAIEGQLEDMA